MKKLFGFTLSEVLIAMAILGVVSALTIPMISGNTTKKQYTTAFKATMNNLQNGIQTFKANNGYDFSGNRTQRNGSEIFRKMLEETLGAKVIKLRTNQQWLVQGIVASEYEPDGAHITAAGNTKSIYANNFFVGSTKGNANLANANNVQNIAFGTHGSNGDYNPRAGATNTSSSVTYKLANGTYILVIPNNDWGCNFKNVRWDSDSGQYLTPTMDEETTNANVCMAYIDVNGPKGPNRITNCMSSSLIRIPTSSRSCDNMTAKEIADVFPIYFFDDTVDAATTAGYSVLNDLVEY